MSELNKYTFSFSFRELTAEEKAAQEIEIATVIPRVIDEEVEKIARDISAAIDAGLRPFKGTIDGIPCQVFMIDENDMILGTKPKENL
jgi:hypothetical protein